MTSELCHLGANGRTKFLSTQGEKAKVRPTTILTFMSCRLLQPHSLPFLRPLLLKFPRAKAAAFSAPLLGLALPGALVVPSYTSQSHCRLFSGSSTLAQQIQLYQDVQCDPMMGSVLSLLVIAPIRDHIKLSALWDK